jgi:hypothetical protein
MMCEICVDYAAEHESTIDGIVHHVCDLCLMDLVDPEKDDYDGEPETIREDGAARHQ